LPEWRESAGQTPYYIIVILEKKIAFAQRLAAKSVLGFLPNNLVGYS
jgi:hypothetical protein